MPLHTAESIFCSSSRWSDFRHTSIPFNRNPYYSAVRPLPKNYLPTLQALMCASGLENPAFLAARPHELPFVLEALPSLMAGLQRLRDG